MITFKIKLILLLDFKRVYNNYYIHQYIVASELKDPICHSNECLIGSFSSEATIYRDTSYIMNVNIYNGHCFF